MSVYIKGSSFQYGAHTHANGIRQHYLRYGGKGPTLVLVPGITSPAITWGFVAERLGQAYDTYVLDVRGRGLSEAGSHLSYDLDTCAQDVAAFAQALGLNDYCLVGHSMGARIGITTAAKYCNRLKQLILIDPPVSGPGRRPYPNNLDWYLSAIQLARTGNAWETLRLQSPGWTDTQVRLRAEWLHTCDEFAVKAAYDSFHNEDMHTDLHRIKTPVMLMVAGRGGVIEASDIQEIQTLLPTVSLTHVKNAGHMIPWDDFDGFFDALKTTLPLAV